MVSPNSFVKIFLVICLVCTLLVFAGPLHDATKKGDIYQLKGLLDKGQYVNAKSKSIARFLVVVSQEWPLSVGGSGIMRKRRNGE
jgi:hypothetical protein